MEPRATEKTYLEQTKRTYVFPVALGASKQEVAKSVEDKYNVKVVSVRTLIRDGKKTKFSKGKHAYPGIAHRQDKKLAYVTLKEGNFIKVFEEPEEDKKADKKADKKTSAKEVKKAEKEAKRTDKNAGKENK